jgi:alkanesulfonate monooxygenase SsuD/methylene tetrahydromethanopterin reductase-like flavin-dependent oxidoreductase (luciferase family)
MQLSAMTEPQMGGTYEQLLALARWSEANGLVSFARSDHYFWRGKPAPDATDAFATLAGMARETETIRLAVLVTPITFRHPAVIAKNAATIDEMSGGRLDLGVGTGWMQAEHDALGLPFPDWSERFARLEEALGYLDAAFSTGDSSFEGDYYRLYADVRPKPRGIRLIVGGQGKNRTPSLAGRHADEYNHFLAPAAAIKPKIDVMRQAAEGRDVVVSVMGAALVGRTDAEYRERLQRAAARRDLTPEAMEQRLEDNGVPFGTPSRAAETMSALEAAGVDKWYVQWLDPADLDGFAATIEALRAG